MVLYVDYGSDADGDTSDCAELVCRGIGNHD